MADAPETPGGDPSLDPPAPTETPLSEAAPVQTAVVETQPSEEAFESQLEEINLKLQAFEGPLDLLVHLIKKNRMNVYDIQISVVTKQYLEYLNLMQELNLDVASEFLVMAATLIHIKSKMLLPRPETAAGDPMEEEDPRDLLVRRLLEHQKFKAAAELLHDKETLRSAQWGRPESRIEEIAGDDYEPEIEVDLFSLLSAFKQVLERARERPPVLLPPEQISIETRIEQLLDQLSETDACGFEDLFASDATKGEMIVTFLAMLEMIRLKLIRVFQQGGIGAIRVYKRARPTDAPHPQGSGIRDQGSGIEGREPGTGSREPETASGEPEAGSGEAAAETKKDDE